MSGTTIKIKHRIAEGTRNSKPPRTRERSNELVCFIACALFKRNPFKNGSAVIQRIKNHRLVYPEEGKPARAGFPQRSVLLLSGPVGIVEQFGNLDDRVLGVPVAAVHIL